MHSKICTIVCETYIFLSVNALFVLKIVKIVKIFSLMKFIKSDQNSHTTGNIFWTFHRPIQSNVQWPKMSLFSLLGQRDDVFLKSWQNRRGSFTAEVEVEISGRGSFRKHLRQWNWVCFQLFVNIYILKTYLIWLWSMFCYPGKNILDKQNRVCF